MCVSVSLRVWVVYISCNFKGYIMHFTQKGVCSKACTVSTCSVHCQCQHFLDACGHCPCCEQSMILFLYFIHSVSRWRGNQCNNPALLYATELISKQEPTCKGTYKSKAGRSRNQITVLFYTYKYLYRSMSLRAIKLKRNKQQQQKTAANIFILIFLFLVYFP